MARLRLKQLVALITAIVVAPVFYMSTHQNALDDHLYPLRLGQRHIDSYIGGSDVMLYTMSNETFTREPSLSMWESFSNRIVPAEIKIVKDDEGSEIPGIQYHLPNLRGNPDALLPVLNVSKGRSGVKIVMGIPTIHRPKGSYLNQTLESLIKNLEPHEKEEVLILIFIAEPWNKTLVDITQDEIMSQFSNEVDSGLIDMISPPAAFYPDMEKLRLTFGDPLDRVKWRTKQNLDFAFLMMHAYKRGQYYIQLEDDVTAKREYFKNINNNIYVYQKDKPWFILSFSLLGFIGKLFHTYDLPLILEFLVMFHNAKPGDWLLDNLSVTLFCSAEWSERLCKAEVAKKYRSIKPSQFQHIGYHSSLTGKVQKLRDNSFEEKKPGHNVAMIPFRNPSGHKNPESNRLETTMKQYMKNSIQGLYQGKNFFWALDPKDGDYISITYLPPIQISKFEFSTGTRQHPNDTFPESTVVEVLTASAIGEIQKDDQGFQRETIERINPWKQVATFNKRGGVEGTLPKEYEKIGTIRIMVKEDMLNWVIMGKMEISTYQDEPPNSSSEVNLELKPIIKSSYELNLRRKGRVNIRSINAKPGRQLG